MKLAAWLDDEGISRAEFGKRIYRSPEAVRRYINGDRIPDKDTMMLIAAETSNRVTANDFFDVGTATAPDIDTARTVLCVTCGKRSDDVRIRACTFEDCPHAEREAA